ncbi:hypothetical protein HYY75_08990 [bacterium]|nr:hypothetical protein [bacterium]
MFLIFSASHAGNLKEPKEGVRIHASFMVKEITVLLAMVGNLDSKLISELVNISLEGPQRNLQPMPLQIAPDIGKGRIERKANLLKNQRVSM